MSHLARGTRAVSVRVGACMRVCAGVRFVNRYDNIYEDD